MRKQVGLAAALAIAVLGIVSWAKSGVLSAPTGPVSFVDRWAPVDEALHSGKFVVKDSAADAP